jgi:hypothetical protein
MSAAVDLIERLDARSPSFDERANAGALILAHRELRETPEAVALARIAAIARRETAALERPATDSPYRAAFNTCLDAFVLARDELDNLIHLACRSCELDRAALPSTGEMVDRLSRRD